MAKFGEDFGFPDCIDINDVNSVFDPLAEDNTEYDNLDDYFYKNLDPYDEGEREREEAETLESTSKQLDILEEREEIAKAFNSIPKHGVHAHAFKGGLDNLKMKKLREEGLTYRAIAKQVGCSPSTVRNRLKKMGKE